MKLNSISREVKMSWRIVLFTILILMFSLPTFIIPSVYANAQDGWVQVSCFTQNNLSLDYPRLSFIVYENNSILLVGSTQFEAIGSQPILRIGIDSIGRSPSTPFGTVTSALAFFMANGSKDYYVGAYYYDNFHVNTTVKNGVVEYEIDFTNNVEKAKNVIPREGTIEDFGIRGTMTFEVMVGNSVAVIKQKRFFSVLLQTHADLSSITCDVTLPQTADIKDAKKDDQDMRKFTSYWVYTTIGLTPLEDTEANLYLEWAMPEEAPLLTRILSDPLFQIIASSIVGSIVTLLIEHVLLKKISERKQRKQFARKLIRELEGIKKDLKGHQPISTAIYDSSTSKLQLFSDETAETIKKTYEEIKRTRNIGFPLKVGFGPEDDEIEKLLRKITKAIDALRSE